MYINLKSLGFKYSVVSVDQNFFNGYLNFVAIVRIIFNILKSSYNRSIQSIAFTQVKHG